MLDVFVNKCYFEHASFPVEMKMDGVIVSVFLKAMTKYYAVAIGRTPGHIYRQWSQCEPQIRGYPGAKYKSFPTEEAAQQWLQQYQVEPIGQPTPEAVRASEETVLQPNHLYVFTDGSCRDQRGGWGAVFVWNGEIIQRWSGPVPSTATNNIAELYAIQRVVTGFDQLGVPSLTICPDSDYSIKSLTLWVKGWRRNGWRTSKGDPVANRQIIETLAEQIDLLGPKVVFQWVPGHAGNRYNEEADRLANEGRSREV